MKQPSPNLKLIVEDVIGDESVSWTRPDLGLSKAERFSVRFARGDRVFVKAATDADTETWLRNEHRSLSLQHSFQPRVVAFVEPSDERPVLLTEDLSQAYWPASHAGVRWRPGDIDRVISEVRHMSTIRAPAEIDSHTISHLGPHWPEILDAPDDFLGLKLCSAKWLERAGPILVAAELHLQGGGEALVHGDVRSDNICIRDDDVIFVDWSSSGRGHPRSDLAELLPTLYLEEGPAPHSLMPDGGEWASSQAGSFARRAISGKVSEDADTPAPAWLLRVFRRLALINLEWAAACVELPLPTRRDD